MNKIFIVVGIMAISISAAAQQDRFKEAANQLCKKMTACIVEQIGSKDDLPAQMRDLVTNLTKTACASIYDMKSMVSNKKHESAAIACFNSAAAKDCKSLQDGLNTPQCDKFEEMTKNLKP